MDKDEKSPTENIADIQDVLYDLEASARGLRAHLIGNGWSEEVAEGVSSHWLAHAIEMATAPDAEKKSTPPIDNLINVITVTLALAALPALAMFFIAGFKWALG